MPFTPDQDWPYDCPVLHCECEDCDNCSVFAEIDDTWHEWMMETFGTVEPH